MSSENIRKKEGGPERSVLNNKFSSVALNELVMKVANKTFQLCLSLISKHMFVENDLRPYWFATNVSLIVLYFTPKASRGVLIIVFMPCRNFKIHSCILNLLLVGYQMTLDINA